MPDIAMCHGTNRHGQQCPRMARCYRAQANNTGQDAERARCAIREAMKEQDGE